MEILDRAKKRIDKGEVYYQRKRETTVKFDGWRLKSLETTEREGNSLRVVKDGRVGFSATTDPLALDKLIEDAIGCAKFGERIDLEFPEPKETTELDLWDDRLSSLSSDKLIEWGKAFIEIFGEHPKDLNLEMEFSTGILEERLSNTSGLDIELKKALLTLKIVLMRAREGDILFLYEYDTGCRFPEDMERRISTMVDGFKKKLKRAEREATISERVPIIFSPRVVPALLVPLLVGINGKNIINGSSPLVGKLGKELFDNKLTIMDDGTLPDRPGSSKYDDEGIPKKRIDVIRDGILMDYLLDLVTSFKLRRESNGCAGRSIFAIPSPAYSNIVVKSGDRSSSELMDVEEGVLIEDLLGVGQGNVLSGAFSNPFGLAFKIEKGEITGRVKNASIAGNVYENLKEITGISKEREWIWGRFKVPFIRLDNLRLALKG